MKLNIYIYIYIEGERERERGRERESLLCVKYGMREGMINL